MPKPGFFVGLMESLPRGPGVELQRKQSPARSHPPYGNPPAIAA
ncbi:hypothetical protein [Laspinema palackyanum]